MLPTSLIVNGEWKRESAELGIGNWELGMVVEILRISFIEKAGG